MRMASGKRRILFLTWLLAGAGISSAPGHAASRSALSHWLSDSALAEITQLAAGHPRLAQRSLHVSHGGASALEEAIAITAQKSLGRVEHLQLLSPAPPILTPPVPAASVDELSCASGPAWDNELQVSVRELGRGKAQVQLDLVDTVEPGVVFKRWRWQGRLSAGERDYLARPAQRTGNAGTISAPWAGTEQERAAAQLSEQLACSLRPDIARGVTLDWSGQQAVPAALAAVVSETRRRLGYYREISEAPGGADYTIHVTWHPVDDSVWQLSVSGTPVSGRFARVRVATYIKAHIWAGGSPVALVSPALSPAAVDVIAPQAGQPASQYLRVEMLDVNQSDEGLATATLRVRLRLSNRAMRPLEYGLSLSGGHYLQCIPDPHYYRHDRYAYLEGRLAPGQSVVRVMEVDGARHRPNPLFGTPRCAGFQDLDGLEDFKRQGHKVTQFIRWSL